MAFSPSITSSTHLKIAGGKMGPSHYARNLKRRRSRALKNYKIDSLSLDNAKKIGSVDRCCSFKGKLSNLLPFFNNWQRSNQSYRKHCKIGWETFESRRKNVDRVCGRTHIKFLMQFPKKKSHQLMQNLGQAINKMGEKYQTDRKSLGRKK